MKSIRDSLMDEGIFCPARASTVYPMEVNFYARAM